MIDDRLEKAAEHETALLADLALRRAAIDARLDKVERLIAAISVIEDCAPDTNGIERPLRHRRGHTDKHQGGTPYGKSATARSVNRHAQARPVDTWQQLHPGPSSLPIA